MSDAVKNENAKTKRSGLNAEVLVIGAIVLGLAALIAYQLLSCASCYGASWL